MPYEMSFLLFVEGCHRGRQLRCSRATVTIEAEVFLNVIISFTCSGRSRSHRRTQRARAFTAPVLGEKSPTIDTASQRDVSTSESITRPAWNSNHLPATQNQYQRIHRFVPTHSEKIQYHRESR